MGRRRQSQRLNIWLNGTPVAYWDSGRAQDTLTYHEDWLADEATRPLSLSLPFRPDNAPYRGAVVKHYFDNLLPDSDAIRRRIAQRFQADGMEPHQLLAAIGRDCVGAIQLLPEGELPQDLFTIRGDPLDAAGVADILRHTIAVPGFGAHPDQDDLRLSIAGAQEKSALLWHANRWHRPAGSTPTTHIFKLPMGLVGSRQADMRTSVENEWLCARIVAAFGLPVASCDIAEFDGMKALIVERFDRRRSADGSWIIRLPQEDFCQATGTSPLKKYQSDGGPSSGTILDILSASENAASDRSDFFKAQLIFWLLAATDGHAKNFSIFLRPGGRFRMTPLYDVLSAHPVIGNGPNQIPMQKAKLAMAVRGGSNHYLMAQIQRRHWVKQAQQAGLGAATANDAIDEILAKVDTVIADASNILPRRFPTDLADAIFNGMRRQAIRLREMGHNID